MARRYSIQHRMTGAYLGIVPSLQQDPQNPPDLHRLHVLKPEDAPSYPTLYHAETERVGIADFADAYRVEPVEVQMVNAPSAETEP